MLEDDEVDRFITKVFFEENKFEADLQFVHSSNEFFSYLEKSKTNDKTLPALIILNMHAVPVNAPGILKTLKSDKDFNSIPVVVLSGSKDPKLIKECYSLGASSFIQKPDTEQETNKKIISFFNYWFDTVELV